LKKCKGNGIIYTLKPPDENYNRVKTMVGPKLEDREISPYGMYRYEDLVKTNTLK